VYDKLSHLGSQILPPQSADITNPSTLKPALEGASAVVSLVGVLVGNAKVMEKVQKEGAENVARVAREEGVGRTVMISAIGADVGGVTP
jgi:NADH dehydrogenase